MAEKNAKLMDDEELVTAESQTAAEGPAQPEDSIKLQAERDALFDRLARLQAEFDNYRKRSAKEQESFRDFAVGDLVKTLLPVIDNFDLALKTQGDVRVGVELIRRQLDDVLAKLGVKPIETIGQPFDPHQHEAIEMVETTEAKDNQVIEELQRGYKLRDKLVRPAMVRVAQNHKNK